VLVKVNEPISILLGKDAPSFSLERCEDLFLVIALQCASWHGQAGKGCVVVYSSWSLCPCRSSFSGKSYDALDFRVFSWSADNAERSFVKFFVTTRAVFGWEVYPIFFQKHTADTRGKAFTV